MPKKVKKDLTLSIAKRVLEIEANAIKALARHLDGDFSKAVEMILSTTGKVVVSGMGKSGIIGQKIASTLASTGTSAFFLHPAEGVHGDLGMLMKNDILLAISNSGETEELIKIIPIVKRMGVKMIAMTGRKKSTLARYGDAFLYVGVKEEACPLGLSPTASTTACLAMGDALAVALIEKRGFKAEDFASLHPAGSLGRKLMRVEELMHSGPLVPRVAAGTFMKDAILEMTAKRMGLTGVFKGKKLLGVITDGDLRRSLEKGDSILNKKVEDVMNKNPKMIDKASLAEAALRKMEEHSITSLFVCDGESNAVEGVVHLHDLIKAGVV
ncbi:MAG: KpsF/GutQ family sugar-phosphate isomerase [Deltaproteobacteria bacterium]|nr:KpsF/GutQ family sugar-phosphate isomerase [Deltaproteobacteria bacterium]